MNIKIEITLTNDEYTEEAREIQVQIEEQIPGGFQDLDKWEADVRRIGFQHAIKPSMQDFWSFL